MAMSEQCKSRIDVHCIPITLAKRKKHRPHLTERVRAPPAQRSRIRECDTTFADAASRERLTRQRTGNFRLRANLYVFWVFQRFAVARMKAHGGRDRVAHRLHFAANADAVSYPTPSDFFLHRHACAHRFKEPDRANRTNRRSVIRLHRSLAWCSTHQRARASDFVKGA